MFGEEDPSFEEELNDIPEGKCVSQKLYLLIYWKRIFAPNELLVCANLML